MARENKPQKEKIIEDAMIQKWIAIVSLSAFLGIGIWMLLDPNGIEHASIEKSSVYLLKEIWSFETGIVFCSIAVFFLLKTALKIRTMRNFTYIKGESGYFMYKNQARISGLESMNDGNDIIVFDPPMNEVYQLIKYNTTKLNKFRKVVIDKRFNCMDAYWNADVDGFYLFYKGVRVKGVKSEYRGDDLIASSTELGKKFRLPNYKSNLDNRIRPASIY